MVLPGEELVVQVIKEGKEWTRHSIPDDGTMIVVDGGKKHVGDTIDVIVTSVLDSSRAHDFAKPNHRAHCFGLVSANILDFRKI